MSWELIAAVNVVLVAAYAAAVWILLARRHGPEAERLALERRFEHQLLHDDLTKLPNRTLFRDRLERALARSVRRRTSCAVLSLDLDRFKLVNDSLGPDVGDGLLRDAAARLDACVRPEDTVARTGGDEFMVLLEVVRSTEEAVAVAGRIDEALSPPFETGNRELFLSASIGIAIGKGGRDRPEDVLQAADVAVHRAKDNGRARHEVFREEMSPYPLRRLGLETDLRRALLRAELAVAYQPIVELDSGHVRGLEALVRWEHPEYGRLEPVEFVPLAEETGLILPLGHRVLEEACARAAGWAAGRNDRPLQVCVNLSARQFQQPRPRLVEEVSAVLEAAELSAASLCLEITESAVVQDVEAAVATMRDLKALGVQLALDDFGTGYSSLNYLRRFPLDVVKIDRSFVCEAQAGSQGEAVLRALIDVCHALDVTVLGEGIEREDQATALRRMGCDLGQGFWFAPPLEAARVKPMLGSNPLPAKA